LTGKVKPRIALPIALGFLSSSQSCRSADAAMIRPPARLGVAAPSQEAAAPPSGAPLYFPHRNEQEDRQHCDGAENQRDKISHCNLLKWNTHRLQSANSHITGIPHQQLHARENSADHSTIREGQPTRPAEAPARALGRCLTVVTTAKMTAMPNATEKAAKTKRGITSRPLL
jgi:hypothetical protein